ncbi:hypothetical protein EV714DRAFT_204750 [Schizophyllum commune]
MDQANVRLAPGEEFWFEHYNFLANRGYTLRSRYDPTHVSLRFLGARRRCYQVEGYEDEVPTVVSPPVCSNGVCGSRHIERPSLVDAVRADGTLCVLRRTKTWSDEIPVLQHTRRCKDERNRVVLILDIVPLPSDDDTALIVMPLLRLFYDPPFSRASEVIDAVRQFMQCLQFLHENLVAHRDFCTYNLMMDASRLIPGGFHFSETRRPPDAATFGLKYRDRSQVSPIKYYVADFGLCTRLPNRHSRVTGVYGQDKTVPELSWDIPYDPFKVDIYQFGNVILKDLIAAYYDGLDFLRPLGDMMTRASPDERPTIDEALQVFEDSVASLPKSDLNRRLEWDREHRLGVVDRVRCCSNVMCIC